MRHLMIAAVAAGVCGLAWGAGLTARSYVQKDLLVSFDGIENAGAGAHSASPRVWADLSGHGNDGALGPGLVWGAEGWSNAANGQPVTLGLSVSRLLAAERTFTVDFACRPAQQTARGCFFSQYNGKAPIGTFAIEHNSSINRTCGGFRFFQATSKSTWINEYSVNAYALAEEDVSLAMTVGTKERKMFKNGLLCETPAPQALCAIPATIPCVVGGEPCRPQMAFRGTFHAFRLYTRQLTEAELMINAAVDAVRYKHLPLEEVCLPEGASVDAETNIVLQVVVATRGAGTIAVDAGVKAGACQTTRRLNETVRITAAPLSAGEAFAGWEGDVDLIQEGSANQPSIVVSAARPFKLTAVFRRSASK